MPLPEGQRGQLVDESDGFEAEGDNGTKGAGAAELHSLTGLSHNYC